MTKHHFVSLSQYKIYYEHGCGVDSDQALKLYIKNYRKEGQKEESTINNIEKNKIEKRHRDAGVISPLLCYDWAVFPVLVCWPSDFQGFLIIFSNAVTNILL